MITRIALELFYTKESLENRRHNEEFVGSLGTPRSFGRVTLVDRDNRHSRQLRVCRAISRG